MKTIILALVILLISFSQLNAAILTDTTVLNLTMNWDENNSNFQVGTIKKITWESENVENVNIEYSTDAGKNWILIEENYPAAISYYDWLIPNTTSIYCKLKITDYSNSGVSDTVPSEFHTKFSDNIRKWHFTIYGDNQWEKVTSPTSSNLTGIKLFDIKNGIAWGPNSLLFTSNGGIDWEVRSTFNSKKSSFVDKNHGWIIIDKYQGQDSSVILHTSDGGANWKKQYSISNKGDDDRKVYLRDISFVDVKNGWKLVVVEWLKFGYLIPTVTISKTTDGGESWENVSTNFTSDGTNLNFIKFIDENIGWCQGRLMDDPHDDYASSTIIYFTTDGGNTWNPGHSKSSYKHFWSYDYSGFSFQTDKWFSRQITEYNDQNKPNILLFKNDTNLYEATNKGPKLLYFKNNDLGWFCGESYSNFYRQTDEFSDRFICMTKDGGTSWEVQQFDRFENFPKINEFFSLDGNVCWAVGDSGLIMKYGNINPTESTPIITNQPRDKTVKFGGTAEFNVQATCSGPLGYQWWRNPYVSEAESKIVDEPGRISGATTNSLKILTVSIDDDQTQYLCEVKNLNTYPAAGSWINSDTVALTVPPTTERRLQIAFPNDIGYEFEVGTNVKITWNYNYVDSINIQYTTNDGKSWIPIVSNYQASLGYYNWLIPNTPSTFCNIKISASDDSLISYVAPWKSSWSRWFTIYGVNQWQVINSNTQNDLKDIKFQNKHEGYCFGDNIILTTSNNGDNWSVQSTFNSYNFQKVIFVDKQNGWGIQENTRLYRTTDGGINWSQVYIHSDNINSLFFIDSDYGWLAEDYKVYKTFDGGLNWELLHDRCYNGAMRTLKFLNREFGWYIGTWSSGYNFAKFTTDGGYNWNDNCVDSGLVGLGYIAKLEMLDANTGWRINGEEPNHSNVGFERLGHTSNRVNFQNQYFGIIHFNKTNFINEQTGWLTGITYENSEHSPHAKNKSLYISMSTDSGNTWELQYLNSKNNIPIVNSLFSSDGITVWAVGDSGLILKYRDPNYNYDPDKNKIDYEITFELQNENKILTLSNGTFMEGENFFFKNFAVPEDYKVFEKLCKIFEGSRFSLDNDALDEYISLEIRFLGIESTNLNKINNPVNPSIPLFMFWGIEVTGDSSGVTPFEDFYQFNEGKKARICIPRNYKFNHFLDSLGIKDNEINFAYLKGGEYFSEGLEWEIKKGQEGLVDSICIYLSHFSEIVGGKNLITSLNDKNNILPKVYELSQNYPNPFNPVTTIKYSIPQVNVGPEYIPSVQLKIFDVLGREIATLVNEKQTPGFYSAEFNASQYSSGIYFYRLQSDDFVQTRKMILIK